MTGCGIAQASSRKLPINPPKAAWGSFFEETLALMIWCLDFQGNLTFIQKDWNASQSQKGLSNVQVCRKSSRFGLRTSDLTWISLSNLRSGTGHGPLHCFEHVSFRTANFVGLQQRAAQIAGAGPITSGPKPFAL